MSLVKTITLAVLSAVCSAVAIYKGQAAWAATEGFLAGALAIVALDDWVDQCYESREPDAEEEDTHA